MRKRLPDQRLSVAVLAAAAGFVAAWVTGSPIALVGLVAAGFLYARGRVIPVLLVGLAFGFAVSALAAAMDAGGLNAPAIQWAAFFAVAAGVGATVSVGTSASMVAQIGELFANLDSGDTLEAGVSPSLRDIHPGDRVATAHAAARAFLTGSPQLLSYRRREPDGNYRLIETRLDPDYQVMVEAVPMETGPEERWSTASSLGDTTTAVKAAQVVESLYGAAFAFDTAGVFTYATPYAQTSIAMTLEDLNRQLTDAPFIDGGDHGWKLGVHPDDYEGAATALRQCLKTGEQYNYEYRVLRATGHYAWHRFAIRPTRDRRGRITGWFGSGFDIDVYKKTEAALRESERSLRELVETVPALIWCIRPDGEPVYFSQQLRDFFGFNVGDKDDADASRLSAVLSAVIHPDDLDAVIKRLGHALATGEPYAQKHRLRRSDGAYRWVEMRAAAMRSGAGAITQWNGVCLDIEDQVRAQEELRITQENFARQSQAASLAELSASIAHEVNQPLAAIVANSHACQRWLTAQPPNIERAQKTVERVIRDANAAADVVSHIRALFRQAPQTRHSANFGDVLAEVTKLMSEEASRRLVRMDVQVEGGLPSVAFDRVQIQQVLINLMRNGMEAMGPVPGERTLRLNVRTADGVIRTEISDIGPGVASPDKIFEPFFTTKGDGMGMGLAICRSIVESHGGRLWVEGNEPQGATFVFTLPVEAETA